MIAIQQPATRCHTVGLVVETVRPELEEVGDQLALEELRVHLCDAVDGVAADNGQMRHSDFLLRMLLDNGHPLQPGLVARVARLDFTKEAAVNLIDDLEMPRQYAAEQRS